MKSLLMLSLLPVAGAAGGQSSPGTVPEPGLEITLQSLPKPHMFRLEAMNRGSANVLVIRPRARMMDSLEQWGGWSLSVKGPHGRATPLAVPAGIPPVTSHDLIELRPGESVGVVISLKSWIISRTKPHTIVPGTYTVAIRYHYDQGWVLGRNTEDLVDVPTLPPVESRDLRFVVEDGTREE